MKKSIVTAAATAGLIFTAFGASANAQEYTYTVHPGDSLWKISQLNNVSINNLKDWNHLQDDRIYVNQKLSLSYTVKSGDSLWDIARSYGTTVSQLKSLNGLTSDLILTGQQLKIPASHVSASTAAVPASQSDPGSYVVQKGDSLSTIGARYDLTVSELKSMNQLTSNKIIVGNILKLRSARSSAAATEMSVDSDSGVDTTNTTTESQVEQKPAAPVAESQTEQQSSAPVTESQTEQQSSAPVAESQTEQKPAAPVTESQTEQQSSAPVAKSQTEQQSSAPVAESQTEQKPAASVAGAQTEQKPAAPAVSQSAESPAATSANVQAIINEAEKYLGTQYVWGGTTPSGFDCSGFVQYVFAKYGISLPRTTTEQWSATTPVSSPSVGDLVFFQTYTQGPSHDGIYIGNNQFISAEDSGVRISNITSSYWGPKYLGARKAF